MKIRDVEPGTTVTIKEGPAKGCEVKVTVQSSGRFVGVHGQDQGWVVRGDLEVEP